MQTRHVISRGEKDTAKIRDKNAGKHIATSFLPPISGFETGKFAKLAVGKSGQCVK
jgi:hypothetical protein